jgi:quercetin dioxygenase-like cupin family protein
MGSVTVNGEAIVQMLGGGVVRKILSHTEGMMVVEITFPAGGVGAVHTHPHLQSSYVKSGEFEYTVGDKKVIVHEGDSLTFEPDEPHGCVCLKAGVLVDVFSPTREDFLK